MQKNERAQSLSRRTFNKTAIGLATGVATAYGPFSSRVLGANERVVMGAIGLRYRGTTVSKELMKTNSVDFVACCDVDRRENEKYVRFFQEHYNTRIEQYQDFRKLLDRNDIDAVLIATPDHWHAIPFIYACEAGKDVFVEKPLSHNIIEGRAMVNAARKHQSVVQVGTWQRSTQHFQDAIDFVRSGQLGTISICRAWRARNSEGIGCMPPKNPPDGLDWDFWLGPAPYTPYRANRCHFDWRWYFDYAGGETADHGAHMMDIVCLAMGDWDPIEVSSFGGSYVIDDDRDTPDTQVAIYRFRDFTMTWEVRWGNARPLDGFPSGLGSEWIGRNGTLGVDRGKWTFFPEKGTEKIEPETVTELETNHFQNFIDCIKSRNTPRSDIETSHKTAVLCHLANISFRTGKKLEWYADREVVVNDPSAMECPHYQREYRAPWILPINKT